MNKYEYKLFLNYDMPFSGLAPKYWFFHYWKWSDQAGFRLLGVYLNLMRREKIVNKPSNEKG